MVIKLGNKVKVEYEGRFEDGEVFDSTERHGGEPLEFVVGSGMLVSGFEKAVDGMAEGEEKEVTLKPEEAYGEVNPQYVQKVGVFSSRGITNQEDILPGIIDVYKLYIHLS